MGVTRSSITNVMALDGTDSGDCSLLPSDRDGESAGDKACRKNE